MFTKDFASYSRWCKEEDDTIRANYEWLSPGEIAELLQRSVGAVRMRASALGIKKLG